MRPDNGNKDYAKINDFNLATDKLDLGNTKGYSFEVLKSGLIAKTIA
jgi:hypothetical protein